MMNIGSRFLRSVGFLLLVCVGISACAQNSGHTKACDSVCSSCKGEGKAAAPEAPKKVSILGDSYSTFKGYIPEDFIAWYLPVPKEGRPTDVTEVEQTWWDIFIKKHGYQLETNNSYSGSTICNTGYSKQDYSDRSFINRVDQLGNPDLILVYGGTNDSWAGSPLGKYVYEGWTPKQLYSFRPATAYMLSELKRLYPKARILFMVNGPDVLKPEIITSIQEICNHYGVEYVMINDIDKMSGHPDQKGMLQIVDYLDETVKD